MTDFFDKIKQGIDRGITTVSVKSKEMLDSQKVRGQVDTLKRQRRTSLEELGGIVYEMYKDGLALDETKLKDKYKELEELDIQVKNKETELEEIKRRAEEALVKPAEEAPASGIVCECGNPLPLDAKFCGKCGAKIEQPSQQEEVSPRENICTNCGSPLSDNARFCGKCGAQVEKGE